MSHIKPAVYFGKVVHRRLRPIEHQLQYSVASLLLDVDQLTTQRPWLLRYNRFGLFSVDDRDHGLADEKKSIQKFAWDEMRKLQGAENVSRILMLSYPRILGYAFNPLTVFYGLDDADNLRLVLFEVHNTFGGRHIYGSGPFQPGEAGFSTTEKSFRVSPFNKIEGHYGLRATLPTEHVTIGVSLTTAEGPILKAYFTGQRQALSNAALVRVFLGLPLMTLKVMTAIHWEALKLWAKGLKLQSP